MVQGIRKCWRIRQRLLNGLAALLLVGGCTALPPLPAPIEPPPLMGLVEAQQQIKIAPVGQTLGAGDVLRITVYDHPDLSQEVTIESQGSFQYPLIGRVQAAGLAVHQVESLLTQRLADGYLRSPQVAVTATQRKSQQVFVIGAVKTPGVYPLQRPTVLLEILSAAGGPTSEAGFEVVLIRAADKPALGSSTPQASPASQGQSVLRIQLDQLLSGAVSQPIALHDGDTIYVPAGAFFYVTGEVQRPGRYRLDFDTTIFKAITLAGGFTKFAATKTMIVQRKIAGKPQDFQGGLNALLQPEDIVVVPASLF